MKNLVVKGAYYFDGDSVLVPHRTGEYIIVDCDQFLPKKEIKGRYSKEYWQENKNNFVEIEGEKYYYAEWGPFNISDEWKLLSDLSELAHFEEKFNF